MENLVRKTPVTAPVKVVQFGEGNFLRAFIDWMIHEMNQKAGFNGSVQIVQPLEKGMCDMINAQGGLYTLILRGVENGKVFRQHQIIESVKGCLNAYTQWDEVIQTFLGKDLRFCFSNTTEAGIEYKEEAYEEGKTPNTFPAKVAALLYKRFQAGLPGMIFLPCELIDKNGKNLHDCILKYASLWKFDPAFAAWVDGECIFCNTLVDRIVAGYPRAEAEKLCEEFGYKDNLLDCGEPFHFFVVEGPEIVAKELPFEKAGLHVALVKDQTPYRTRKVRFLNGAHTSSVLAAYLAGFDFVDEMVADSVFGKYLNTLLFEEIFITVQLPEAEKKAFASAILERFANPFAMHRLLSISLNSVSKWKVRVMPSLLDYVKITGKLPKLMSFSLAGLIAFYKNEGGVGKGRVNPYPVSDNPEIVKYFESLWKEKGTDYTAIADAVLSVTDFWGMDLRTVAGLTNAVAESLKAIETDGVRLAVKGLL